MAARLTELGFTYVGGDIDVDALDDVRGRGFEAHELDLFGSGPEIVARLEGLLDGRPLAAVLALDVIEHLVDPVAVLSALHEVVSNHIGAELVVSIPNVTHVDIGSKLLVGRWDMTDTGLLDDTHLQFFSEPRLVGMLGATGWLEVDADDVELPISDQCFPVDLPGLRREAPLHDVFAWVRRSAGPGGETYQFVRRLRAVDPIEVDVPKAGDITRVVDEDRPLATVVITVDDQRDAAEVAADAADSAEGAAGVGGGGHWQAALGALLGDLAAQSDPSFEIVVVAAAEIVAVGEVRTILGQIPGLRTDLVVEQLGEEPSIDALVGVLRAARGRHVTVLGCRTRVSPGWLAGVRDVAETRPAALIHVPISTASPIDLGFLTAKAFDEVAERATACDPVSWDLLHDAPMGPHSRASLVIPIEVVQAGGLVPEPADGDLAWPAFALRVALMAGSAVGLEGTLVVAEDDVADLDERSGDLLDRLAAVPLIGRVGSVGQLGVIRSRLDHHRQAERELRGALDHKAYELDALIGHVAELGREVDRLRAERIPLSVHLTADPINLLKRIARKVLKD